MGSGQSNDEKVEPKVERKVDYSSPITPQPKVSAPKSKFLRKRMCEIPNPRPGHDVLVYPIFVKMNTDQVTYSVIKSGIDSKPTSASSISFIFKYKDVEKQKDPSICRVFSFIMENLFRINSYAKEIKMEDVQKTSLYEQFQARLHSTEDDTSYAERAKAAFSRGVKSTKRFVYTSDKTFMQDYKAENESNMNDLRVDTNMKRLLGVYHIVENAKYKYDAYAVVIDFEEISPVSILTLVGAAHSTKDIKVTSKFKQQLENSDSILKGLHETMKELEDVKDKTPEGEKNISDTYERIKKEEQNMIPRLLRNTDLVNEIKLHSRVNFNPESMSTEYVTGLDLIDNIIKNDTMKKAQKRFELQLVRAGADASHIYIEYATKQINNELKLTKLSTEEYELGDMQNYNPHSEYSAGEEVRNAGFVRSVLEHPAALFSSGRVPGGTSGLARFAALAGTAALATAGGVALWRTHGDKIKSGLSSVFGSMSGGKKAKFAEKELIYVITALQGVHSDIENNLKGNKVIRKRILSSLSDAIDKLSTIANIGGSSDMSDDFAVGQETSFHDSEL
jgi:hypothetical protein